MTASSTFWIHFAGTAVRDIFSDMDITAGIYESDVGAAATDEFRILVRRNGSKPTQAISRDFAQSSGADIRRRTQKQAFGEARRSKNIDSILEYMNMNYEKSSQSRPLRRCRGIR